MIARKPKKFSLNSSESTSDNNQGVDLPSPVTSQNQKQSAADTATSILEELGVKKPSSETPNRNNLLNVKRQTTPKKVPITESTEREAKILYDLKRLKSETDKIKSTKEKPKQTENKKNETKITETEKTSPQKKDGFGFHEKFVLFTMLCVIGVFTLAFIGGYLKVFDWTIFRQLTSGNIHQLEFAGEFEARQVENGYNRLPLFIVEGAIRNTFFESDIVEKIQLKAFAFDAEKKLITTQFSFAGVVLSDIQLETLSPMEIKDLHHSGNVKMLKSKSSKEVQREISTTKNLQNNEIPFQIVFFKVVPTIKRTSLQIVSYVRNNKLVYVRAPDLQ